MGMYTELMLGVEFKQTTPKDVIDTIRLMTSTNLRHDDALLMVPESCRQHPLFSTDRWCWMLQQAGSYYFDAIPFTVTKDDVISESFKLTFIGNIKNYTNEWECFLDFIAPHLESNGFIGYMRYEEDEHPSIIYNRNGTICIVPVVLVPPVVERADAGTALPATGNVERPD